MISTLADLSARFALGREQPKRDLAASITRDASKQAYYIIRLLVDRERAPDAYRAYAYFRWVDDYLDQTEIHEAEALGFVSRQQMLLNEGYCSRWPQDLTVEEQMLATLVQGDQETNSGLQAYLRCMMEVMAFDAGRRGKLITQRELDNYTYLLAKAVTEALHHFIGHGQQSPRNDARYLAATAAHIVHMLRDAMEDASMGYYNIPLEYLHARQIGPQDVESVAYRTWVRQRVLLARRYFEAGRTYLTQVQSRRCRLAGHLYMARFETVLDAIERDDYRLRQAYPECKSKRSGVGMGWSMLTENILLGRQGNRLEEIV